MSNDKRFVALTSPDARGRFNLRKHMAPGVDEWIISCSADRKTITLEAVLKTEEQS